MKKFFYTIAAAMTLAACSSEDNLVTVNEPENNLVPMTFTASQEGEAGTRAGLNATDKTKINWKAGDQISINGSLFTLSSGAGEESGSFSGTTAETTKYTAVYPNTGTYVSEGEYSGVVLPSEQTATSGSFDPNAAIMMAVSDNKTLAFKNAVGFIKVTPEFNCEKIILRAADKTVPIAGKGTLKYNNGAPYIDFTNSTEKSYTITLSGSMLSGYNYYITVPAVNLTEGWTLTFIASNDIYIRKSSSTIEFQRSKAMNLGTFDKNATPWVTGPRGLVSAANEVDLGLTVTIDSKAYKVIFADRNLTVTGLAANETEFGDYFAWGAIEPWLTSYTYSEGSFSNLTWQDGKSSGYEIANAPYNYGSSAYTEYTTGETLTNKDDAAKVILGGDWQIPTKDVWTALNGLSRSTVANGVVFTNNEKTLSLPIAGQFSGTDQNSSTLLYYWSNYNVDGNKAYAYYIPLYGGAFTNNYDRYLGHSIRPIRLVEVHSGSFEDVNEDNTFTW